jgi:hypothetical protein
MATVPRTRTFANRLHKVESLAAHVGKDILGGICLVIGVALSATLFLIPLGVPLALLGVALLVTASED